VESTARWSSILFWTGMAALVFLAATQLASRILANRSNILARASAPVAESAPAPVTGRHLSEAQKQALETAMAPYAGQKVSFACNSGDFEAEAYAREFRAVLRKAGWTVVGGENIQAVVVPAPVGVNIYVNREELDARRAPKAAVALAQALIQFGIVRGGTLGSMNEPDIPPDLIGFFVGSASQSVSPSAGREPPQAPNP
jgi:hypothetical protein